MVIGHKLFLWCGITLLLILSSRIEGVQGEDIGVSFSFLTSSIATMKSVFTSWSWWSLTTTEQPTKDAAEDEHHMREPTKRPDVKIVFDSFYEEDYGIADVYMEEQPLHQGIGRLSHQRKRDSCSRDDTSQNCGANHSGDRYLDSKW